MADHKKLELPPSAFIRIGTNKNGENIYANASDASRAAAADKAWRAKKKKRKKLGTKGLRGSSV